jgi:predicted nucleic acid-binding protein
MTVFDTDFLVSLLRDRAGILKKQADLIENPKTTIINAYELYYGAERSENPEDSLLKVDSLLKSVDILGFDKSAALKAAKIQAELMDSGRPVNILDVLIAGIVMVHNEEILTRDNEHFSRIKGLRWKRW